MNRPKWNHPTSLCCQISITLDRYHIPMVIWMWMFHTMLFINDHIWLSDISLWSNQIDTLMSIWWSLSIRYAISKCHWISHSVDHCTAATHYICHTSGIYRGIPLFGPRTSHHLSIECHFRLQLRTVQCPSISGIYAILSRSRDVQHKCVYIMWTVQRPQIPMNEWTDLTVCQL